MLGVLLEINVTLKKKTKPTNRLANNSQKKKKVTDFLLKSLAGSWVPFGNHSLGCKSLGVTFAQVVCTF